jgi:hypothetical protein
MTEIKHKIIKMHFYLLAFIFFNFIIGLLSGLSLNYKIVFSLKIILYLSGFILFFFRHKLKKTVLYFSFYFISPIILILFWLFGGIFLGILSSIIMFPINLKEVGYEKDDLRAYSKFEGFLGRCCTYEIVKSKLLIFEKKYGEIKHDGTLYGELDDNTRYIKIENDSIIFKYEIRDYDYNKEIEIKYDTIQRIKID